MYCWQSSCGSQWAWNQALSLIRKEFLVSSVVEGGSGKTVQSTRCTRLSFVKTLNSFWCKFLLVIMLHIHCWGTLWILSHTDIGPKILHGEKSLCSPRDHIANSHHGDHGTRCLWQHGYRFHVTKTLVIKFRWFVATSVATTQRESRWLSESSVSQSLILKDH